MKAFSLIELSIVLVILGLLTGGILAGKSLIRASELRSVASDYQRYLTAVHAFKDKYFYLPGDTPNATQFWGALDGNNGTNSDCRGESSTALTCNGDGDGQLCINNACASNTYESYLFWKHLANAGLIEGTYTGSSAAYAGNTLCPATNQYAAGCNVPTSKIGEAYWLTNWMGQVSGHGQLFDGNYGNMLVLSLGYLSTSTITAPELWNIDTKLDDGKPAFGKLRAARWNVCATGAASTADGANASYILNDNSIRCIPVFANPF
jgi:prepilin-type N-terminal cleavage/methylation domain-containing protein